MNGNSSRLMWVGVGNSALFHVSAPISKESAGVELPAAVASCDSKPYIPVDGGAAAEPLESPSRTLDNVLECTLLQSFGNNGSTRSELSDTVAKRGCCQSAEQPTGTKKIVRQHE
jgi:hypothetical protein